MITYETNYLAHHGILGMKWGVRRYQNKDGSLTPEGRRRSGTKERKKSKHRTNLEKKYISQGYSKEAAEQLASNRIKSEIALAVIGGIALGGIIAGTAYKVGKDRARTAINENGMTLKVGDALQRVQPNNRKDLNKPFYAVNEKDKSDVQKYRGNLGLARKIWFGGAYKSRIDVNKEIKVPSQKEAESVFSELYKNNPDFKKQVDGIFSFGKTKYEAFNQNLVGDDGGLSANGMFFDALKKKGFGAVLDINDQKFSGYNAKAPIIVFDTSAVSRKSVKKLGNAEIAGNLAIDVMREKGRKYAAGAGIIGTGVTAIKFSNKQNQIIEEDEKRKKKKRNKR